MIAQLRSMLGTDTVKTKARDLLSISQAPTMYANYDSGMRQVAAFRYAEGVHPLKAIHRPLHCLARATTHPRYGLTTSLLFGIRQVLSRSMYARKSNKANHEIETCYV
jgi:hypothetical protein